MLHFEQFKELHKNQKEIQAKLWMVMVRWKTFEYFDGTQLNTSYSDLQTKSCRSVDRIINKNWSKILKHTVCHSFSLLRRIFLDENVLLTIFK